MSRICLWELELPRFVLHGGRFPESTALRTLPHLEHPIAVVECCGFDSGEESMLRPETGINVRKSGCLRG